MSSHYQLLTSEAEYRGACDRILGLAQREIMIFDRELFALRPNEKARLDILTGFLQGDGPHRIRMVLHNPEPLMRGAPRLVQLIARFSHAIEIRQSPDNLRHLADTHVLADENHGLRRFQYDQPRSALILDDPAYLSPWRQRFEELWELSQPCLSLNTTGL